jgi:hypothetical protein
MPVLFQCGEFDEARPDTVREQAALVPNAEVAVIGISWLESNARPGCGEGLFGGVLRLASRGGTRVQQSVEPRDFS